MSNSSEIADINKARDGIVNLDTSLKNLTQSYLAFVNNTSSANEIIKETVTTLNGLDKAQKQTKKNTEQLDELNKKLDTSTKQLKDTEEKTLESSIKARIEKQKATKETTLLIKAQQAEKGSKEQLIAVTAILENRLNKVNLSTEEGRKKADLLRSAIDRNNVTIKENSSALGAQRINIGNYGSALNGLWDKFKAGEIGAGGLASGVASVGKAMFVAFISNPILLAITAISGALYGLYKLFAKSDEFGNIISGTFKAIGNVIDVLMDRGLSFVKFLGSVLTFNWEGIKKNGKDAFDGIGKSIKEAATAGYNYVQVLDDIEDRENASLIRAAKLREEIENLKNVSKDQTKTNKERQDAAQAAYDKEIELFKLEKQFASEKTQNEKSNLASKIQNSQLSIKQKEEELQKWLMYDDKEINSAQEKDAAFKEFYDKNEADFKNVQKMMADEIMQKAGFNQETRRLLSQLSGFKKELAADDKKNALDTADSLNESEKQKITQKHIDGLSSEQQYQDELINQEIAYLTKKMGLYKSGTKEYEDIESQIQGIKLKSLDKQYKDQQDFTNKLDKLYEDQVSAQEKSDEDEIQEAIRTGEKILEEKKKLKEKEIETAKETAEKIKDIQFEMASEAVNGIFDLGSAKRDEELSALDLEREKKLDNDKLTAKQKEQINAEYDKKAAAIKTKQAKADKLQAIFNIALNTGVGVMKATAEGLLPLIPWIIALGAVQAGMVAAKPIPKFKDGTENAPFKGIFGEAGRELLFPIGGGAILANEATYFEGNKFKGATIKSNAVTEQIIARTEHSGFSGKSMTDDRILKGLSSVERAILSKPVAILDKDNRIIGQATTNSQTIYLNRLMRNN